MLLIGCTARPKSDQGGAHPTSVRAAIRRRPRAGESAEAERDRRQRARSCGVHLLPALGNSKLDAIKNEDVQRLKGSCESSRRRRSTTC